MDHEGFHYRCTKTTREGKCYYVCATPNVFCKGTALKKEDGTIIVKKAHTHSSNDNSFIDMKMKRELRELLITRAKTETKSLKTIYDEESIRNPQASAIYTWPTAESSMRHARRQAVPPLPDTLRELGEYLDMNIDRYRCNNHLFYQEWIVDEDGKYNIMFACDEVISAVVHQGTTELHADGTFKVVPSMPRSRQLFMIHLILQNHSIPVCFVLMEAKSQASYVKVLERFKAKFPSVRPTSIMIDFETSLHNAFHLVYPEAQLSSCWFHYVQSLQKNIKKMGYTNYVQQNMAAKMCIRMTTVLALLPSHLIEQGFQEIKTYAQDNGVLLPRFFTYFTSFWLLTKGPQTFSVYNQPRRTNNNIESFHSSLKQNFQVLHPNLWKMLEHLSSICMKQHVIVDQLARGLQTTRALKMKNILNSVRIKNASDQLAIGAITVKEFLIKCSHSTDRYLTGELNWDNGIEVLDSEDEQEPIHHNHNDLIPVVVPEVVIVPVDDQDIDLIPQEPAGHDINRDEETLGRNPEIVNWDENDFFIPEDLAIGAWEASISSDEEEIEIQYVQVPQNLLELYPAQNNTNTCVICKDSPRTHVLVPCGHKMLCADCVQQLQNKRCPICNTDFTAAICVYE